MQYIEFVKKATNGGIGNTTIKNTNNNTKNINMFYVINRFKNAYNYEDLMEPPLTSKETKYITDNGALSGCCNLILNRCVNGIELENRPFHCVDSSRNKYLLHTKDDWSIDNKGEQILKGVYPKINKVFELNNQIDNSNIDKTIANMGQILEMNKYGKKKIINVLTKKTLLKNNIK